MGKGRGTGSARGAGAKAAVLQVSVVPRLGVVGYLMLTSNSCTTSLDQCRWLATQCRACTGSNRPVVVLLLQAHDQQGV